MFRADLHCHTTCSDGTLSPHELLYHAKEIGLAGISITDHDTVAAYKEAPAIAKQLGLLLGSGAEFSTLFAGMSVHILAYDFTLSSPFIAALCHRHEQRRRERNRAILEKLKRLNFSIQEEELLALGSSTLGRPHIAQLMVQKKYVRSIQEAFHLYLGDHKSCFVLGESISAEETIEIIHKSDGKAFLAHPHLLEHQRKIRELLKLPFDGIECRYAKFAPEQEKRWITIATEKNWLISGGSDFHGNVKEYISLGCSWVDEKTFHQIFQHVLS